MFAIRATMRVPLARSLTMGAPGRTLGRTPGVCRPVRAHGTMPFLPRSLRRFHNPRNSAQAPWLMGRPRWIQRPQARSVFTKTKAKREKSNTDTFQVTRPTTTKEILQLDGMVYTGAVMFGGIAIFLNTSTKEEKRDWLLWSMRLFRDAGIRKEHVNDEVLATNIATLLESGCNNILASPLFYSVWHLIHRQSLGVSILRGFTGTLRIVPFMTAFYCFAAYIVPYATQHFLKQGDEYETAYQKSQYSLVFGISIVETIVELMGCGVVLNQMTLAPLLLFYPALIGRIVSGVLLQIKKTGAEFENILPASYRDENAPEWQQSVSKALDLLAIDESFFITLFGTSVFQHILNGVTFIMLTRGKATTLGDIGRYMKEGGFAQLLRTIGMRFSFCLGWNWLSSQKKDTSFVQLAIDKSKEGEKASLSE